MKPLQHFVGSKVVAVVALVLAALMVASMTLAAWSLYVSHREGCAGRNDALGVIRDVLRDARASGPRSRNADAFYAREFARIAAARC